MRDGLLRHSEASALRWGDAELHEDGSGRLHVARFKTDQSVEGAVIYLGPAAAQALLAIRAATRLAGLGDGFTGHSPRVGMDQDLSAVGAELPVLMTAGRWDSPTMPA